VIYWISQDESASGAAGAHEATWRVAIYRGWLTVGLVLAQTLLSRFW